MDMATITQLIGSLGFPIAMCIYMMVVNNKTVKDNTDATRSLQEVMQKVLDKLG